MTVQELYRQALRNAPETMPARFSEMDQMAALLLLMDEGRTSEIQDILPPVEKMRDGTLYCLTNHQARNGASVLLYPGLLKECAAKCGKDLVIFPSSLHEILLMPLSDEERLEELTEIVREINQAELKPEEILSDHIYRYDYRNDRVVMV